MKILQEVVVSFKFNLLSGVREWTLPKWQKIKFLLHLILDNSGRSQVVTACCYACKLPIQRMEHAFFATLILLLDALGTVTFCQKRFIDLLDVILDYGTMKFLHVNV